MDNCLKRTKRRNSSLIKLRKGDIKLSASKSKQNNPESFAGLYEEYLKNRKMKMEQGIISKKSIEILSSNNLNIFNEFGSHNKEESRKLNKIDENEQSKNNNGSKNSNQLINIQKKKLEKKEDNSNDDFGSEDNINKKNMNRKDKPINNNKNKIVVKEKNKSFKRKKTKFNIKLNEIQDDDEDDEENSRESNEEFSLKIFYEGKGFSMKISKKEKFSKCLLAIQKVLFPFYKLNDYDILYKLKILDPKSLSDEILSNIIDDSSNSATFYLRKKIKEISKNHKETTVLIENFPSFTDLATELNKFFEGEKRESNFTVDYKGSICKVCFSEPEKAFSLIIFLTKLKKINPIYKRLKINMDYKLNVVVDTKKIKQKPMKLILPLINKNSFKKINKTYDKKILKINTEKNIYNYKSRNENNIINNNTNFNSIPTRNTRRYDSCLSLESKIIKNDLKNKDSFLDDFNKKLKNQSNIRKSQVFTLASQEISLKNNNSKICNDSAELMSRLSKIKSTNFIIDLNKKKKKDVKTFLINKDENKNLSPEIRPKKLNYYNLFVKNLSKKYKDSYLGKNKNDKKDNSSVDD